MTTARGKKTVLVQVKISRGAAALLRRRAKKDLRTQASYLRALIYRDLNLVDSEGSSHAYPVDTQGD